MKVKEIVKLSAIMLGRDDIVEYLEKEITKDVVNAEKDINLLVKCINLIVNELATEYFAFSKVEGVEISNGKIYLDNLSERLVGINKLLDKKDELLKYTAFPNYLKVEGEGEVYLDYNFAPKALSIEGELQGGLTRLTERVICYGVSAEYSLINGMFEEAVMWDKRFRDSLLNTLRRKENLKIPQRIWR